MLDYSQLETLATVLRLGSFEAAAHHLHVTQSAISQRIRQLEDRIGAPLVQRGTPCVGTETGKRLARHAQEVALMEARVTGTQPDPLARLRIAVNADSLGTWVLDALAEVPDQLYEIIVDDQDHSADWLRRGEVSAAITAKERPPQGCTSIPLGVMVYVATASPEFMQKHLPKPVDKSNLQAAPMLVFNKKDTLQDIWIKQNFGVIHIKKSHTIPSTEGFVTAARLGLGWGMNPQALVDGFLVDGSLVRLVDNSDIPVPLFWQAPRHLSDSLAPITVEICRVAAEKLQPVDKIEKISKP